MQSTDKRNGNFLVISNDYTLSTGSTMYNPQVQEQCQQHIHEQQQKIQLLQAVIEKQKLQIERKEEPELPNVPLEQMEQDDMSHEAMKMAFSKLQVFVKALLS